MSAAERPDSKIPTRNPQPVSGVPGRGRAPAGPDHAAARRRRDPASAAAGSADGAVPGSRAAILTDQGITVYPARCEGDRWRAVWYEPDGSRGQCQSVSQQGLAARLEKVTERLAADALNMLRSGSELIGYYLSDDRRPAERAWSRRHADTQRYLCARYLEPVIGHLASQDIRVADMQAAVNAAPTAKEGKRVQAMISALVGAGISGGYLASDRLKGVHWQAQGRPVPAPRAAVAGESMLFVDPAEMPGADDVARLGQAVGANQRLYELMVNFAAYTGLRWGELIALTAGQVSQAERVVTVGGKVAEVRGHLFAEAPKNRKRRRTIYPRTTPAGWPLAEKVAARIAEVAAEQASGRNPLGLMFPTPAGKHWRSSNFNRRVLKAAYLGWRSADSGSRWTWHSLRHVFCTTALTTWGMDVSDVSRLAGHANVRVTLEMYVGSVVGALERARRATD
jgi:integrase